MAPRLPSKTFRAASTSEGCALMDVTPIRSTIAAMRMNTFYGALLLLPLLASAQQKPNIPGLGASIEVSIVNVDVFVTDRAGDRVHGLTKDDFEIYENGVKQPISNFTEYVAEPVAVDAATAPDKAPAPAAAPQQRTIILFVERFYLPRFRAEPMFA